MSLTFTEVGVPRNLHLTMSAMGATHVRRRRAPLADGTLRVMSAMEPVEPEEALLHISISVGW